MATSIQHKLAAIIAEIDRTGHADVLRLTVLKKWFRQPGCLAAFGLWVARRAAAHGALSDGVAAELLGQAHALLTEPGLPGPRPDWSATERLYRRSRVFQDQLERQAWGPVRMIRDWDLLLFCDVADVFRFVNEQCQFLAALTPLQPRYAKQAADADSLMAVIIAQAMNHGNLVIAKTSDIPYHVLEAAYQQYLRQASLQAANDRISNGIASLPIFPNFSFALDALYGSVDGQKFGVERPTVKAQYSRKYFGRGKGVVAYTLLCNHVPLQGWLIGAHEFEAHHVFDIWYRNTSEIVPTVMTGDMHSINKANFAILHWFGLRFEPRFTDLEKQLKELYCADDPSLYEKCLIRPVGQIDLQAIADEKANIDQIVATLGLKEMTQGTLIRKLCTYTAPNPTRRAIFEFDRLIRSIYTLRYLRDPQLQRNVHRSQNRIESYHQLRSAIAQVGGKKELTGRTHIEIEISNQCARLIANAIIYYNSAILSRLLARYEASGNAKALTMIKKIHTGGVAPRPSQRALHVSQRRTDHRPGCNHGRARFGLTEFSGVWAYNPTG